MTMTMEEWHKAVDAWVARENARIGQVCRPSVGMYPPEQEGLIVSEVGMNNRIATADLIMHYADAIGDINPLWRDEHYARSTKYGGIIAPPRFLDCIAPPSGMGMGFPDFQVPGLNPLNCGSKYRWYKTIHAGDVFNVHDRWLGVRELTKKERPMPRIFIFEGKRDYINQRDEIVGSAVGGAMVIGMGPEMQEVSESFKQAKKHVYTEEELEKIFQAYDNEFIRGADTLFWEDVVEGEALPTVVKGPITLMDSVAFFHVIGYTTAFRVTHEVFKVNKDLLFRDPDNNVPIGPALLHVSDNAARVQGVPHAICFAAQAEGNVCHAITNWMGDDGFLKRLDCQARHINLVGNTNWINGHVVKKYKEDGEYLVDLELKMEDQDGNLIIPATATVRLLSKTDF